ncbi:hypothetical protein Tco_0993873 [Tanacetum coccineum]
MPPRMTHEVQADLLLHYEVKLRVDELNLLPALLAQVGNHGSNQVNGRNQNDDVGYENIQGDVRNVIVEKMESVQEMSGCGDNQKVKYTAGSFVGKALTWNKEEAFHTLKRFESSTAVRTLSVSGRRGDKEKAINKGAKEEEDEDLQNPYKEVLKSPFTRRIIEFSAQKHRMPTNLKIYDGSTNPDDHVTRFIGEANQREW